MKFGAWILMASFVAASTLAAPEPNRLSAFEAASNIFKDKGDVARVAKAMSALALPC